MTELTIREHLKLISRTSIILLAVYLILFFISWYFANYVIGYIIRYFDVKVYALTPWEYLDVQLEVALVISAIFFIPILLTALYLYIKDEISVKVSGQIKYYIAGCVILAIMGSLFGYYIFARYSLDSFKYNPNNVIAMWGMKSFFIYIFLSSIVFAVFFQMTLLIPLLDKFNILKARILSKGRLWVAFIFSIIAAWLTPSVSLPPQIMMFIPMYLCFEVGLMISKIGGMRLWHGV